MSEPPRNDVEVAVTMTEREAHILAIALYDYGLRRPNGRDETSLYTRLVRASGDRRTHPAQQEGEG